MTTLKRFLLITAFATFPLTFLSCDYWWGNGDGDLPDGGLIAHYPLDGDADENVGGRDGIIVGATPVADRFGEAGRALRFDGDDFVRVDESGVFNFDLQEDSYTISLWANASNSDGLSRLVVKWDELTSSPYPFQINKVGSGAWGSVFDSQEVSTVRLGDVWDGTWKHLVVSYDSGSNRLAGYLDGALISTAEVSVVATTQNAAPLYIGRAAPPREDRYFVGSVDEIRIYDRALTTAEVGDLFDAGD